jgi:hypothetical protein
VRDTASGHTAYYHEQKDCGNIQTFSRKPIPDDQEWNDYIVTMAGQTSLAIENVTLITNEELAYNE